VCKKNDTDVAHYNFNAHQPILVTRWDHPYRWIEMKFCMVGGLQETVLRFEFNQNPSSGFGAVGGWNLPFLIDLAIGLYKIVISQQIKEVIANGHEKLKKLKLHSYYLPKIIKIGWSTSKL